MTFKAYAPDHRLCVVTALKVYIEHTGPTRGLNTQLFLTTHLPVKPATRDMLSRWTKTVLNDDGIDLDIFKPHSTRSAASSKAA